MNNPINSSNRLSSGNSRLGGANNISRASSGINISGSRSTAGHRRRSRVDGSSSKASGGGHGSSSSGPRIVVDGIDKTPLPLMRAKDGDMREGLSTSGDFSASSFSRSRNQGTASALRSVVKRGSRLPQHALAVSVAAAQAAAGGKSAGSNTAAATTSEASSNDRMRNTDNKDTAGAVGGAAGAAGTAGAAASGVTSPLSVRVTTKPSNIGTGPAGVASPSMAEGRRRGEGMKNTVALNPTKGSAGDDDELDKVMEIVILRETPTITILHIAGVTIAQDGKERAEVEARHNHLSSMKENSSATFVSKHAQTLNAPVKHKEVMASRPATREMGCHVTSFDIHDSLSYSADGVEGNDAGYHQSIDVPASRPSTSISSHRTSKGVEDRVGELVTASLASVGCLLPVEEGLTTSTKAPRHRAGSSAAVDSLDMTAEVDVNALLAKQKSEKVLQSESLGKSFKLIEMALQQNLFHSQQIKYRATPSIDEVDERLAQLRGFDDQKTLLENESEVGSKGRPSIARHSIASRPPTNATVRGAQEKEQTKSKLTEPKLTLLWNFGSSRWAEGREVAALAWSTSSNAKGSSGDLLAVGYGEKEQQSNSTTPAAAMPFPAAAGADESVTCGSTKGGLVAFWSLRSPLHPECMIPTQALVTALQFSKAHPNLLAIGFADGAVCIYDVSGTKGNISVPVKESAPSRASSTSRSGHEPIWQVSWVPTHEDKEAERLVTISNDGRVTEWDMKKGGTLMPTLLMSLKRQTRQNSVANLGGSVGTNAFGLSFAFLPNDPTLYLAASEDGTLVKCSISYNETPMDTYTAHDSAIYGLRFSPFSSHAFLTCGADWSIKLWNFTDRPRLAHILSACDTSEVIYDIDWSPQAPTILASVTGNGRLHIWDVAKSTVDPILTHKYGKQKKSSVAAGEDAATKTRDDVTLRRNSIMQEALQAHRKSQAIDKEEAETGSINDEAQEGDDSLVEEEDIDEDTTCQSARMTCVAFGEAGHIIAAGTSTGLVGIFCLEGLCDDKKKGGTAAAADLDAVLRVGVQRE